MLLSQQPHVLEKSLFCFGKVRLLLRTLLLRTPRAAVRAAASPFPVLHACSLSPARKKDPKKYPFVTAKKNMCANSRRRSPSSFVARFQETQEEESMASMDAQRRVVPAAAGAAAAPPARPSLQSIMRDAQTLLEANEAAAKQELARLQQKVRAQGEELAGQRTALDAANTAALNSKKLAEEVVSCILLVACCSLLLLVVR